MAGDVAIVGTRSTALENGRKAGAWAEELVSPYYFLGEADFKVVVASSYGGKIPLDENSLQGDLKTPATQKWLDDGDAQKLFNDYIKLSDVNQDVFGFFAACGHGAAVDFPSSRDLSDFVSGLYVKGKLVLSVCHGAVIFKLATDGQDSPLVKGKAVGKDSVKGLVSPEKVLKALGGIYSKAPAEWGSHIEVDLLGAVLRARIQVPAGILPWPLQRFARTIGDAGLIMRFGL